MVRQGENLYAARLHGNADCLQGFDAPARNTQSVLPASQKTQRHPRRPPRRRPRPKRQRRIWRRRRCSLCHFLARCRLHPAQACRGRSAPAFAAPAGRCQDRCLRCAGPTDLRRVLASSPGDPWPVSAGHFRQPGASECHRAGRHCRDQQPACTAANFRRLQ